MTLRRCFIVFLLGTSLCAAARAGPENPEAGAGNPTYRLDYEFVLHPAEDRAEVSLALGEGAGNIVWMRFRIRPGRHTGFSADGELEVDGKYVTWTPPETGGRLSFSVPVSHRRGERYDARMTPDWALFRGDDLVPPARVRQKKGAEAEAFLRVRVPEQWSFVAAYREVSDGVFVIENPERGFDRPTGWMVAGRLGVRREHVAGVRVAVAGPVDQGVRRMDMLAFLNWNLPRLAAILPRMPERLVIVSARDQMWRGGLSGPHSLYIHADRPLLSENGTSTLLHELVHVVSGLQSGPGGDWVVEGLAEYYSLKLMWRSGTITDARYQAALEELAEWAQEAEDSPLDVNRATGPLQARAVGIMREVDREIRRATGGEASLDEVLALLSGRHREVDTPAFVAAVEEVMGGRSETLASLGAARPPS
ncbi:MAG: hypothetical protein P8080_01620 [Gammaproteobacteria bacterium]